jgi:hypothetical protein
MTLPAIQRPNGKLYRPRVITSEFWVDDEEIESGVIVLGTHDFGVARYEAFKLLENWEGGGWVAVDPERRWLRKVIRRHSYMFENYPDTGRACVWFRGLHEVGLAAAFAYAPDAPRAMLRGVEAYRGKNTPTGVTEPIGNGMSMFDVPPGIGPGNYLPDIALP